MIQLLLQVALAVVVFYGIVRQRDSTAATYLLGYGVVIPVAVAYIPFELLEVLQVQNHIVKLGSVTLGTVVGFRTIEAMHGTSPAVVESTIGTYMTYYTSLMHFEWDPKTLRRRRITGAELWSNLRTILIHFHLLCLVLSFEMHVDFKPFHSAVDLAAYNISWDLLSLAHLGNAYCLAVLTYLVLATGFDLTAFNENVKGIYTKPIFLNPLFTSRTPTEFWGDKWNLMIHRILKHGVFLPAKQFVSSRWAVLVTFVASGLLHDYSWALVFYHHRESRNEYGVCEDCFQPFPFKLTAFFLWNGVVMMLERPLAKYFAFTRSLPTPLVSTLVLCTALPVSHWYSGDWAVGGYFSDFAVGLWHVRKLSAEA